MPRAMLILHALCAAALVGAVTHDLIWTLRYTRGRFGTARAERRFVLIAAALYAATFSIGLWLYPHYKADVRLAWLDRHQPAVAHLFDIKEHLAAIALPCLAAQLLLARRAHPAGRRDRVHLWTYVGLAACTATLLWAAAVIGLYTVSWRSFGGGA